MSDKIRHLLDKQQTEGSIVECNVRRIRRKSEMTSVEDKIPDILITPCHRKPLTCHPPLASSLATRIPLSPPSLAPQRSFINGHLLIKGAPSSRPSINRIHKLSWPLAKSPSFNNETLMRQFDSKTMQMRTRDSVILLDSHGGTSYHPIVNLRPSKSKFELVNKLKISLKLARIVVRVRLFLCDCKTKETRETETKHQTLAELNYYSHHWEFSTKTLVFNKLDFIQSASTVSIPLWARLVMEQDPFMRSDKSVKKLVILLRSLKAFRELLSNEKQDQYCRHCQYMCVDKRKLLLKTGQRGFFCYLIFSGSVFVNIDDYQNDTGKVYYRTVTVLKQGEMFGDASLVHETIHTANYISREKTELIVIDKDLTVELLGVGINRELAMKIACLQRHGLFADWSELAIETLAKHCEITKYPYNAIIEDDTGASEFIFMVVEGMVEILLRNVYSSSTTDGSWADDNEYFSDSAIYRRLKQPNQCQMYAIKDPSVSYDVFISLELLYPDEVRDLHSLTPSAPSYILVSHGSKVLKIPKHYLQTIPTNHAWRKLLAKAKQSPRYPSQKVLQHVHHEYIQWNMLKSFVTETAASELVGKQIAMKTPHSKGTRCGMVKSLKNPMPNDSSFKTCLEFEAPLCNHGTNEASSHTGQCILNYVPPRTRLTYDQKLAILPKQQF